MTQFPHERRALAPGAASTAPRHLAIHRALAPAAYLLAALLVAAVSTSVAQDAAPPAKPAAKSDDFLVPANVRPKPGHDESYLFRRSLLAKEVVLLHAEFGDELLVQHGTGELTFVPRAQCEVTSVPFARADEAAMRQCLAAKGFGAFKTLSAKPFFYAYACSDAYFKHVRSVLESLYPGYMTTLDKWGLEPREPQTPLAVIVMGSRAEYDAYKQVPAEVLAYYEKPTNFVVLYEDQKLWDAAPDLALKQASYTIAHEGVHQLLASTGIQRRFAPWPYWVVEGIPEYFCPLRVSSEVAVGAAGDVATRAVRWTQAGMINDLRMHDLLQISANQGEVARGLLSDTSLDADEYALAWGVLHYLASKQPAKLRAYLQDLKQSEAFADGTDPPRKRPDQAFVKHFGDDYPAIEEAVRRHLTSPKIVRQYRDPLIYQTYYVVKRSVRRAGASDVIAGLFTSPAEARAWQDAQLQEFPDAKFHTKVCETLNHARNALKGFQFPGS